MEQKKLGFPVPIRHWLKDELYDWAVRLIQESPTDHLFNKPQIMKLLENHVNNKTDNSREALDHFNLYDLASNLYRKTI